MRAESTAHRRGRRRWLAGIGGLIALRFARVGAQDSKGPITLIVPAPAGVSADRLGRVVADGLSAILEVPVQVDNLSGDGGVTGTNAIAASARDGTVLGLAISSAIIGGRLLSRAAKFSPIDDFQWLTVLGSFPNAMVVAANSPHSSIASWLDAARETPVPWVYASVGTGSAGHLAGAYLRLEQRARLVHRTVESNEERYALLAEGKIAALFEGIPNAVIQSRRLGHQIIAVTSGTRVGALPGVPSFGELWQRSFVVWLGLIAPKGLDNAAYVRLAAAIGVLVTDPRYADAMRAAGLMFMGLSGRAAIGYVESAFVRDAKLIATLNDEGQRN